MKISKRDKYALYVGAVFLFFFLIIRLIVFPFIEKKERAERNVQSQTRVLGEMRGLKAEYETLTKQSEFSKQRFAKRKPGFTLFSFLDRLAGEAGVKENIAYMKPSKSEQKDSPYKLSIVEMKLQGINLKQLTPYLHMIETSEESVFVRRVSITKKGKGQGFIDVILQVETFEI